MKHVYAEILGDEMPEGCELVAYTDDVALIAGDLRLEILVSVKGSSVDHAVWHRDMERCP